MEEAKPDKNIEDQKSLRFIEKLEKHRENTHKSMHYSLERFDILIITLSSAALGFSMGFIKDIVVNFRCANLIPLKISWFCFGFAVILNLASQVTSYWCSHFELRRIDNEIAKKRRDIKQKSIESEGNSQTQVKSKPQKASDLFNTLTHILNYSSIGLFIAGIILIIIFVNNHI